METAAHRSIPVGPAEAVQGEISYDLVMIDEMAFVEGTLRIDGGQWQVFIVSRRDVADWEWDACRWDSGVAGLNVRFPRSKPMNKGTVEAALSSALGIGKWTEVRGPDSMQLR